jgi:hypothetical protein
LEDIKEDQTLVASTADHALINEACYSQHNDEVSTADVDSRDEATPVNCVIAQIDEVSAHLLSVSPTLVPRVFAV